MEYPLWRRIEEKAESGDVSYFKNLNPVLYPFYVLTGKMRQYIIKKVKKPLEKAITSGKTFSQVMKTLAIIVKRIPAITPQNRMCKKTALVERMERRFTEYNRGRPDMFEAAFKLFKFEIEHDGFYQGVYDFWMEQQILMVLTGEWPSRFENIPFPDLWDEPRPYGGKYTIVSAIQRNREKIIELLGDEWQYLKEVIK